MFIKLSQIKNLRIPLTIKITFSFVCIIFVALGINAIIDIYDTRTEMEDYEIKNNISIFTSAIPVIENAYWDVDIKTIDSTLSQIMKNININSVYIFNNTGEIFSFLERNKINKYNKGSIENIISNEVKN